MMAEEKDTRTFNKRLMDAMAEMENPTKSKTAKVPTKSGKEFSYNYESLDQVLAVVRPALTAHGLMLVQGIKWHEPSNGYVLETGAMDDTEVRIMDTRPIPSCNDAQAEGSWETYKRRYALRTAFGLTGEDDDGEATKKPKKPKTISPNQSQAITEECALFAEKKGKTVDEVWKALASSNTAKGHGVAANAKIDGLTYEQAGELLNVVRNWNEQVSAENLAPEDIEF